MKKSLYVTGIVKDSKNNMEKYLFSENERLNSIIDELEERIDKALHKLKSSVNHFRTQRENNAVTFTIRILEGKENE